MLLPAVVLASCSTVGNQSSTVAASKPIDPASAQAKAAARQRWEDRVERDNKLDSSGSEPGYYGSFGPRITW
jgi:hypothetical protein